MDGIAMGYTRISERLPDKPGQIEWCCEHGSMSTLTGSWRPGQPPPAGAYWWREARLGNACGGTEAALQEALELLRSYSVDTYGGCLCCGYDITEHDPKCELAAFLAKHQ